MTTTAKPLFTAQYAPDAQTTMYTATGVRTIIDKLSSYNPTAGAVSLAVNIVPSAGAAGASNIVYAKSLAAGEGYTWPEVVGHVIEAGGFISIVAGAATSVVVRASGREVT